MVKAQIAVDYTGIVGLVKVTKQRTITLKAVKAGAKCVQASAKANAPRRKKGGGLRQAIGVKAVKGKVGKTVAIAVIGARTKVVKQYKGRRYVPGFIAHIVDQGAQPHTLGKGSRLARKGKLSPSKRKGRKGKIIGAKAAGLQTGGLHPGAKASRFLERAWTSNRTRAAAAAKDVMTEETKKALAKASADTIAKARSMQRALNKR